MSEPVRWWSGIEARGVLRSTEGGTLAIAGRLRSLNTSRSQSRTPRVSFREERRSPARRWRGRSVRVPNGRGSELRNRFFRLRFGLTIALASAAAGSPRLRAGSCARTWEVGLGVPGANSPINALFIRDEGDVPVLYAGGRFTQIDGVPASKIARWNGVQWSALGSGISGVGAAVHAMTEFDDGDGKVLFVGGEFTGAGGLPNARIAQWDGFAWSDVGGGVDGTVFALTVFDDGFGDALYAGGAFSEAGGVEAMHVARWDGMAWSPLGVGLNGTVHALGEFDDGQGEALYAGGEFTASGTTEIFHIARWNGAAWLPLADGLNGPVFALTVFNGGGATRLYAGGSFTNAAEASISSIVSWDGVSFGSVGGGTDAVTRALAVFDDGTGAALYAGGTFQLAGGTPASRIARWNGLVWSTLGIGANNAVFALASTGGASLIGPGLFAAGSFTAVGGQASTYVARWVDCGDPPGDVNGNGSIDLTDFVRLSLCIQGPGNLVQPACRAVDFDSDTDIDLRDLQAFGNVFTGVEP